MMKRIASFFSSRVYARMSFCTLRLKEAVTKYAELAPPLASWMEANIPEGLNVFKLPKAHQRKLRTSNWLENLNGKIKKRTSVVGLFHSVETTLRSVSAVFR